jgi:hypothetical protein
MKSLMQNRGGVSDGLAKNFYQQAALVPPMPWISSAPPKAPAVKVGKGSGGVSVDWSPVAGCSKYAVQARYGKQWVFIYATSGRRVTLRGIPDAVAVSSVDRYGNTSAPAVLSRR